jgi:hypothetical protein
MSCFAFRPGEFVVDAEDRSDGLSEEGSIILQCVGVTMAHPCMVHMPHPQI